MHTFERSVNDFLRNQESVEKRFFVCIKYSNLWDVVATVHCDDESSSALSLRGRVK